MKEEAEEEGEMEHRIQKAIRSRAHHFRHQAHSFTLESARRVLEKDLELDTYALDVHKRYVKQLLEKLINGTDNRKIEVKEEATEPPEEHEMEEDVKNGIWKRSAYLRSKSEEISMVGVRRLLEEDLQLEKYSLDPLKKLISEQIDEVLNAPNIPNSTTPIKKKISSNYHSKPSNSSDSERDDEEAPKKKVSAKGKVQKSEGIKKREGPAMDAQVSMMKKRKLSEEASKENSDGEDASEDGQSRSSAKKPVKKKKEVLPPACGKQVERLKSTNNSCGMSVEPAVHKKAKHLPDAKCEGFLTKELEEILKKEGLSADASQRVKKLFRKTNQKSRQSEHEQSHQPQVEIEHEHEAQIDIEYDPTLKDDVVDNAEEGGEGFTPFPGGPTIKNLLHTYTDHVAASVWKGEERGVLKCYNHTSKLSEWKVLNTFTPRWVKLVEDSKLYGLKQVSYKEVDKVLVSAFVERWHPETNTFHMPFGEMTITLEDVYCLTGLPVSGIPVFSQGHDAVRSINIVMELLGVSREMAIEGMKGAGGPSVRLEWLRETFHMDGVSDDPDKCVYSARAYMLYTLGCTLFTDKSGNRVNTTYLEFLREIDNVHTYAWGAGSLAFLYRQLGQGSRASCKQMAGYLTLLEAWIYERFSIFRPPNNVKYNEVKPRAMMWQPHGKGGSHVWLQAARERLDTLKAMDVKWTPYSSMREKYPFTKVALYNGCLGGGVVVEPYHPDRVLRQFGYVQTIPSPPFAHNVLYSKAGKKNQSLFAAFVQYFRVWDSHTLSADRLGRLARPAHQCAPDYIDWYTNHSHPIVQNPKNQSHVFSTSSDVGVQEDSWEMVRTAQSIMAPILERWRSGDYSITVYESMDVIKRVYMTLSGPSEAKPSTARTSDDEDSD